MKKSDFLAIYGPNSDDISRIAGIVVFSNFEYTALDWRKAGNSLPAGSIPLAVEVNGIQVNLDNFFGNNPPIGERISRILAQARVECFAFGPGYLLGEDGESEALAVMVNEEDDPTNLAGVLETLRNLCG